MILKNAAQIIFRFRALNQFQTLFNIHLYETPQIGSQEYKDMMKDRKFKQRK